ncbi:MAG TPA: hypothetical protein VK966_11155 [Longimicrobiales bacterium]|nr:hypothetical protein [Longimicrobiales bacterium]
MKYFGALMLTLLMGVAACDSSDAEPEAQEQAAPGEQLDTDMAQRFMELQTIQQQLRPVQEQALQDEEIAAQLEEIQTRMDAAMREEKGEAIDRMTALQEELMAAQTDGDQEAMQTLMAEAQGLQVELQEAQSEILERPEFKGPVEAFEAAHRARMIEIDPEAEALLDRMDELVAEMGQ